MDSAFDNPDPSKYARGEGGAWILLPRQCPRCKRIYTPVNDIQSECESCMPVKHVSETANIAKDINRLRARRAYYKSRGAVDKVADLDKEIANLTAQRLPVTNAAAPAPAEPEQDSRIVKTLMSLSQSFLKESGAERVLIGDGFCVLYKKGIEIHL